jgi:hypothetical protein
MLASGNESLHRVAAAVSRANALHVIDPVGLDVIRGLAMSAAPLPYRFASFGLASCQRHGAAEGQRDGNNQSYVSHVFLEKKSSCQEMSGEENARLFIPN